MSFMVICCPQLCLFPISQEMCSSVPHTLPVIFQSSTGQNMWRPQAVSPEIMSQNATASFKVDSFRCFATFMETSTTVYSYICFTLKETSRHWVLYLKSHSQSVLDLTLHPVLSSPKHMLLVKNNFLGFTKNFSFKAFSPTESPHQESLSLRFWLQESYLF